MKTIETYRKFNDEDRALNPQIGGLELPQLIDFLAEAYGHLNGLNCDELSDEAVFRIVRAKQHLRDALTQLDININGYKI